MDDLDRFPPAMVRLVARTHRGRRPMSVSEIARRAGIGRSSVVAISSKTTWRGITLDTIIRFTSACGVNLLRIDRHIDYLRRRKKVAFGDVHARLMKVIVEDRKKNLGGAGKTGGTGQRP